MAVVAGGTASTEASVSSTVQCPPYTSFSASVELPLKWADFGELCIKGGHMSRGLCVPLGSRNLFREPIRPAPELGLS